MRAGTLAARPSLTAGSWRRRHVDRTRSCYGSAHVGTAGLGLRGLGLLGPAGPPLEVLGAPLGALGPLVPPLRALGALGPLGPLGEAAAPLGGGAAMMPSALAVGDALRRRAPVPDAAFDEVFPEELRERSALHWTPVEIAARAAELLAPSPGTRVLDVGAGVGKLCLIGALVTGATWWGIEQDAVQVAAANHAAWALGVTGRTRFVHGDGSRLPWDGFDAFYFYNPFSTVMLAPHASPFVRYATIQAALQRIERRLAALPSGARVVTYHGFGGHWPAGFSRIARELAGEDALELWIRDGG